MKYSTLKIFALLLIFANLSACTSLTNLLPKAKRPFEKRPFEVTKWKEGDYQTRGEMAENLISYHADKDFRDKSADEVRQLLGKPDAVTKAPCCHARFQSEVEAWVYYIEIERESYDASHKSEKTLEKQAVIVYYGGRDGGVLIFRIDDRDGNHAYFPIVG